MSFYLEESTGEILYITNNYLKQKLIDSTSLSTIAAKDVSTNSGNDNISKHFFERIGVDIPTLDAEKCADVVLDRITYANIDDLCAVVTLDKVHIVALAYLLYMNLISTDDLLQVIRADSIYTRSSLILQYIAEDDTPIDIFSGLKNSIIRYSQKQYATEYHDAAKIENDSNIDKQIETLSSTTTTDLQFFTANLCGFGSLVAGVEGWETPSLSHAIDAAFDNWKTNNWFETGFKKIVQTIVNTVLYTTLSTLSPTRWLNYIVEYFNGCTLASTLFEKLGLLGNNGTIKLVITDIMNEFIINASIGVATDKFNHRLDSTEYSIDTSYIKAIIQDAFANAVNRESDKLADFWKVICNYKTKNSCAYLFSSILKAEFVEWEQNCSGLKVEDTKYDTDNKNEERNARVTYLCDMRRPFQYFKKFDDLTYPDMPEKQLNKMAFSLDGSKRTIYKLFNDNGANTRYTYPSDFYNTVVDSTDSFLSTNSFLSFAGSSTTKVNQTMANKIKAMLKSDLVIGESIGNGEFYEVKTLGGGELGKAIELIIDNSLTANILTWTSGMFSTTDGIINKVNAVKESVKKYAFKNRGGTLDIVLPFAYEIVMNYLDFLVYGNGIYYFDMDNILCDAYIDGDTIKDDKKPTNEDFNVAFQANVFEPAISNAMFIYYRLLYTIKNAYDLALPCVTTLKTTAEYTQLLLLTSMGLNIGSKMLASNLGGE